MIKVLGIGGGAREHSLAEKVAQSAHHPKIYWISEWRNPGIYEICRSTGGEYIIGSTTDPLFVSKRSKTLGVDLVIIGPEEPNFYGVADAVRDAGIPCLGPYRDVAVIEQSKAALRRLQWKYDIPGRLLFRTFRDVRSAKEALNEASKSLTWLQNVVLKPARQAGGKGVKVIEDKQAYLLNEKLTFKMSHIEWLSDYMSGYEDIQDRVLAEECVWGPEYTLHCFTDGKTVVGMPLVQDNKHAFDFDIGPETGGMGSISGPGMALDFITREEYERSLEIVRSVIRAIQDETGKDYIGVAAGQMMVTEIEGPTLIEMYSRLGDPEALNVLAVLKTDILDLAFAICEGRLSKVGVDFEKNAVVVKAVAPEGYPDRKDLAKGHEVLVDRDEVLKRGCKLYWGAAHLEDGRIVTTGSRFVELVAKERSVERAAELVNGCLGLPRLKGWRTLYRVDIGTRELNERRTELAEKVRRLYKFRESRGLLGSRLDWVPGMGLIDPALEVKKYEVDRT
ncbi:MAG: phosphoribosylamine--glycine ligase [Aigarchaeota archaeon]|nr:phosphoribosylamine--glycine ligase [Aigarchaeota archaeon]MDW8092721.1 phosphoribosylamine--glycine ligase [Nitrososphaerota archaeon]